MCESFRGERAGIKLHVSLTNDTNVPLQVLEINGFTYDRPIGIGLEDKRFILVGDRAYFSNVKAVDCYVTKNKFFSNKKIPN